MTAERTVPRRAVGLFAVLALGGAWLASLPLHLGGGLQNVHRRRGTRTDGADHASARRDTHPQDAPAG
jgi:hypothetical protein